MLRNFLHLTQVISHTSDFSYFNTVDIFARTEHIELNCMTHLGFIGILIIITIYVHIQYIQDKLNLSIKEKSLDTDQDTVDWLYETLIVVYKLRLEWYCVSLFLHLLLIISIYWKWITFAKELKKRKFPTEI